MKYYLVILYSIISIFAFSQNQWMDTTYHANHSIATVGVLNKSDSLWTRYTYYKNGCLEGIEHYLKDSVTPNGQWEGFLPNGNILYSYQYRDWELHGFYYQYHANGSLKIMGKFFNGYKTGIWNVFDNQLNLISSMEYNLSKSDSTNTSIRKKALSHLIIQFPPISYSYLNLNGIKETQTCDMEIKIRAYEPIKK